MRTFKALVFLPEISQFLSSVRRAFGNRGKFIYHFSLVYYLNHKLSDVIIFQNALFPAFGFVSKRNGLGKFLSAKRDKIGKRFSRVFFVQTIYRLKSRIGDFFYRIGFF